MDQRLIDEKGLISATKLAELQEKISTCMTRLFRQPQNGGNPFLYSFAMSKPHYVTDTLGGRPLDTAATDGKSFFWSPNFLSTLNPDEVATLMSHETTHVALFHCERMTDRNHRIANIAFDYTVNGHLEADHIATGRDKKYPIWGGNIGNPLSLAAYLNIIDGKAEFPKGMNIFCDVTVVDRSPESIYDEIYKHWMASPRLCKTCTALSIDPKTGKSIIPLPWEPDACQACGCKPDPCGGAGDGMGSTMDAHLPSKTTRTEILSDLMRAKKNAAAMRGTVPSGIADVLKELEEPTLTPAQIVKHAMFRKAMDKGIQNDWTRFRRRYMAMRPSMYIPKKKSHVPRWVAMIDTSGSMRDEDIANVVKELKLISCGEGWIVPNDGKPYWDKKTKVESNEDICNMKVHGRGGTVFDEFFRDLPKQMPGPWDVIIIGTDGDCGTIDPKLRPDCDVLWILSNKRDFTPTFGRVIHLNQAK